MLFELPKTKNICIKNDSGKLGRICVSSGSMSIPQIVNELEWPVSGDYQWDVSNSIDGTFKIVFLTKAELDRLRRIKFIDVEDTTRKMHFKDLSKKVLDKWGLFDIWVRAHGCPDNLCRDYLALFALGSLIGKTREVDMRFTKEHGIVRMRIGCANPQDIPSKIDYVYEEEGFGILFYIENGDGDVVPASGDLEMDDAEGGDGGGAEGNSNNGDDQRGNN
jgi:hypothetical protein